MLIHFFGAISSPASANFALPRTAADNKHCFAGDVINTVKRNFSMKPLTLRVHELQALLSRGGFKLTKWISNSRKVIEAIPAHVRCAELKKLERVAFPTSARLAVVCGIRYLTFNICLRTRPLTRRGILSVIGSVFDPLGFVVPVILNANISYKIFAVLSLDGTMRFHLNITQAGRNGLPMS